MNLNLLRILINNFLETYNNPPETPRERRKWLKLIISRGEKIWNLLHEKEYKDLASSISEFKTKFHPKSVKRVLRLQGFDEQ